jgi:preprotein translocase subunit YajC
VTCVEALVQFVPFLLILVLFWFLIIRPARKKQQAVARLRASLSPGDTVLLGSGFYGTIAAIEDDGLRVEISPGVVVRVHRDAVVSTPDRADEASTAPDADQPPPTA